MGKIMKLGKIILRIIYIVAVVCLFTTIAFYPAAIGLWATVEYADKTWIFLGIACCYIQAGIFLTIIHSKKQGNE